MTGSKSGLQTAIQIGAFIVGVTGLMFGLIKGAEANRIEDVFTVKIDNIAVGLKKLENLPDRMTKVETVLSIHTGQPTLGVVE